MLLAMHETDLWQEQHPNVTVVLADEPAGGADWRDQEGWGLDLQGGGPARATVLLSRGG